MTHTKGRASAKYFVVVIVVVCFESVFRTDGPRFNNRSTYDCLILQCCESNTHQAGGITRILNFNLSPAASHIFGITLNVCEGGIMKRG